MEQSNKLRMDLKSLKCPKRESALVIVITESLAHARYSDIKSLQAAAFIRVASSG
jgi:hypothetical protein